MKKTKQSGQHGRKSKTETQPRKRAHDYRKCPADEKVFIQLTDEQGRKWARVRFSRLEYTALQAVCSMRACTMQELCNEAVATELARGGVTLPAAAQPGLAAIERAEQSKPEGPGASAPAAPLTEQDERRHRLADIEEDVAEVSAMVKLLGLALAGYQEIAGWRNGGKVCLGLSLLSTKLADDLEDHWDAAFQVDVKPDDRQAQHNERQLLVNLNEAAAFTHAASLALADVAASTHSTDWKQMGKAYEALGHRLSLRVLSIVDAATPPARQTTPNTVNAEVAA